MYHPWETKKMSFIGITLLDCEALNNFWVQNFIVTDRMGPNYSYGSGLEGQAIFYRSEFVFENLK